MEPGGGSGGAAAAPLPPGSHAEADALRREAKRARYEKVDAAQGRERAEEAAYGGRGGDNVQFDSGAAERSKQSSVLPAGYGGGEEGAAEDEGADDGAGQDGVQQEGHREARRPLKKLKRGRRLDAMG